MRASVRLAHRLERANQLEEALAVLDGVLQKLAEAPDGAPPFDDLDQLHWVEHYRVRVLQKLGRWDEAIAGQIRARDASLVGDEDLASQRLNLGELYVLLGQPEEALVAIEAIKAEGDGASPYGLAVAAAIRICAYVQLGDEANLASALAYLRENGDSSDWALRTGLLCANDQRGLARVIMERLEDSSTRSDALEGLQDYLPSPHETKFSAVLDERFEAVRSRADVRAAIAKYGRILSWPSFPPDG
jgi:tetratricopeptide (TPR) repeat protein